MINLTQHPATPDQIACGVIDTTGDVNYSLKQFLTFDDVPTSVEVSSRAMFIAQLAKKYYPHETEAMIGGALWLMAPLAIELKAQNILPVFAFSKRVVIERPLPDGTVKKEVTFKHAGFVLAK